MFDIAYLIDPDHVPLCPICDQPIFDYEEVLLFTAHGQKGLGHSCCVKGELNDE
jgi:hypothetical protein